MIEVTQDVYRIWQKVLAVGSHHYDTKWNITVLQYNGFTGRITHGQETDSYKKAVYYVIYIKRKKKHK